VSRVLLELIRLFLRFFIANQKHRRGPVICQDCQV
jgi:hypothetical protein